MESVSYNGYGVWGHAILQQEDILQPERNAASGTITAGGKLITRRRRKRSFKQQNLSPDV